MVSYASIIHKKRRCKTSNNESFIRIQVGAHLQVKNLSMTWMKSNNSYRNRSIHLADRDVDFEDDDDEDSDEEDHNRHDWPKSIDLSHKWLLKHEVIVLQGIGNLEVVLKNLISNL